MSLPLERMLSKTEQHYKLEKVQKGSYAEQWCIENNHKYILISEQLAATINPDELADLGEKAYNAGDYETALEYLKPAAEAGNAKAQTNLGNMYYYGYDVSQSYEKAVEWYQKAADQGYARAQNNLGHMYYYGLGVTPSYEKAVEWYQKAADQGYADAQRNLGYMYENGYGVTQSYEKAVEWYQKAADQGYEEAQAKVEELSASISMIRTI